MSLIPYRCGALIASFLITWLGVHAVDVPICEIKILDQENGWPVPLVELTTTHHLSYVSDNAGRIAVDAPELMGRETWFFVEGQGYTVAADGFGYRGVRIRVEPGASKVLQVQRVSIAKRIGRLTGGGLFAESQKLGFEAEAGESGLLGCDSVQMTIHQGKPFWAWGDTTLAHYPLGIFHMSGGTTDWFRECHWEPPLKWHYDYFRDQQGKVRAIAPMAGEGPTWLSGFASLPDRSGSMRLVAMYHKIRPPLESYETGLCVWDEEAQIFRPHRVIWKQSPENPKPPQMPEGHAARATVGEGREWVYFGNPIPTMRIPARFEAWEDPMQWEPLEAQADLVNGEDLSKRVKPHSGSIGWSPYRNRWVSVFMESFGKPSAFGEIWYAEADSPTGPWGPAVKVLSHVNYTFYNPRVHVEFSNASSPVLLFEGTYTLQFSGGKRATARYDYNQVLYRLDLDDARLMPARYQPGFKP